MLGGHRLPAAVLAQIVATTDGIPLFVEEVTKAVVEAGSPADGQEQDKVRGPLPVVTIPATLHEALLTRLDRLGSAKGVATLIVTLLIIRRWPRSVTRTIPSADKRWRLSDGYGARPRRVSSSSSLMASRSPWPRGCSTPSLVVSSKTPLPPA